MNIYPYTEDIRKNWKTYPVRIQGNRVCCSQLTILVQSMEGGYVTQNCKKCQKKYTLGEKEFFNLNILVTCPTCKNYMVANMLNKNYGFICRGCDTGILLASILPKWDEI